MLSTLDASNQKDFAAINENEQKFDSDMDKAAARDPADATATEALKRRDIESVDNGCMNAVNLGLNAMDNPSMLSAQAVSPSNARRFFQMVGQSTEASYDLAAKAGELTSLVYLASNSNKFLKINKQGKNVAIILSRNIAHKIYASDAKTAVP
jgi:hypothetical protein